MNIKILIKHPKSDALVAYLNNDDLPAMQKIVGGYIETMRPFADDKIVVVCNEDGKRLGLPANLLMEAGIYGTDIVVGTIFVAAFNGAGDFVALTDEQTNRALNFIEATKI